jgi:hypothetical protein
MRVALRGDVGRQGLAQMAASRPDACVVTYPVVCRGGAVSVTKIVGGVLIAGALIVAVALLGAAVGMELPQRTWIYWVFLLFTGTVGSVLLTIGLPDKGQILPLRIVSFVAFALSGAAFVMIILALVGAIEPVSQLTLWVFFVLFGAVFVSTSVAASGLKKATATETPQAS